MTSTPTDPWQRYKQYLCAAPSISLTLDVSRMHFDEAFLQKMEPEMQKAFASMDQLEKGAIANPDENRMVGHYWLRAPELAPTPALASEINSTLSAIKDFASQVH